jgi:CspA family cold shock protein
MRSVRAYGRSTLSTRHVLPTTAHTGRHLGSCCIGILHEEGEVGHVKWFDDRRGFGFIRTYDRQDIFVHHSQLAGEGYRTVEQGQRVRFKRRFVRREGAEVLEAIDVEPVTE